jgi:hypothetical protein
MNTFELFRLAETLTYFESTEKIQSIFEDIISFCNESSSKEFIFNAPIFVSKMHKLESSLRKYSDFLSPIQQREALEIGADRFFDPKIIGELDSLENKEKDNPGYFSNYLEEYIDDRKNYISYLSSLEDALSFFNPISSEPQKQQSEISFLLPSQLFSNSLDGLSKELGNINKIIRTFSEVSNGGVEEIKVSRISTSEPVFVFSLNIATILSIGGAITWGLSTWKSLEEIRKLRAQVAQLMGEDTDVLEKFDKEIDEKLNQKLEKKTKDIISKITEKTSIERANELQKSVHWSLSSLLARLERNMLVEINSLINESDKNSMEYRNKIIDLQKSLNFPPFQGDPILSLLNKNEKTK